MNNTQKSKYLIEKQWRDFKLWKCLVPLIAVIIIWPVGAFIVNTDHSFQKVFSDGDLLIFASLLLIGIFIEFKKIQLSQENLLYDNELDKDANIALVFAIIFLIIFGAIKVDILTNDYIIEANVDPKLTYYSITNIIIAFFAVIFASRTFWIVIEKLLKEVS